MRFKMIAVVLALSASAAFAQYPQPAVTSIDPSTGSAQGGTLVTIKGSGFEFCPAYLSGCTFATVTIGGKTADVVERDANHIVVRTPANNSGTYDVLVTTLGGTVRRANAFTYGSRAFVRFMLPTYIEGEVHGTFDSRWVTELSGFLRGRDAARLTDDPSVDGTGAVTPGVAFSPAVHTDRQGLGRFVYVSTEAADRITLNLRVRDISRSADNLGVEVPVVRSEDTFGPNSVIAIVNVPVADQYRQKLRIYDFEGEYGRTVRVHIGDRVTRDITLSSGDATGDFPAYPGYADIDLNLIPELAGLDKVTVTIDTPSEGRFWAYVSVTNNNTQQVTTVTP